MEHEPNPIEKPKAAGVGTLPLVLTLVCMGAVTAAVWVRDSHQLDALQADRAHETAVLNQALSHANNEIRDLSSRLDDLSRQPAPEPAKLEPVKPEPVKPASFVKRAAARPSPTPEPAAPVTDPRVDRLQGQLTDTQNDLARTRDEIARNRTDIDQARADVARTRDEMARGHEALDGRISSTRDELNASIAKTHDEVLALRKRGEQNVYEFRLTKSKQTTRVGPLAVALRSTSPKHRTYDLDLVVEDNPLSKKHVNLYEPVWINLQDRPQPVELVVNHVAKDEIVGYVTEPKYKKSELAATSDKPAERPDQLASR